MRCVGYVRVSTAAQELDGVSLEAQTRAVRAEAERRGWSLELVKDTASAKTTQRPGLEEAISRLDAGEFGALIVSRLDRLSRTVGDFASLMASAEKAGWVIVVLDPPVDLSTPFGRAMANVAASFAQLERELVSQRTREGLAEARRRGKVLGGPVRSSEKAVKQILSAQRRQLSYRRTAEELEALGIKTATGKKRWDPATVGRIARRGR